MQCVCYKCNVNVEYSKEYVYNLITYIIRNKLNNKYNDIMKKKLLQYVYIYNIYIYIYVQLHDTYNTIEHNTYSYSYT